MIKTSNLDKYFNEGKQNSIHVINDTSLEFPQKGLVSLVGQSGSGKTTLLNVISGLDKAKGKIEFDDVTINKYKSHKWDKIRSHDMGYIFQNYYLLEDRSVSDNISVTLNMIGIVEKEEVEYRTNYVLKAVDMYRFRNKKASDLSGGQKQRVAIARAIAKNPKVIIADEPTGNLDSANSIEVMKIIKKISEERLVVLVTHNMPLAFKYSDRIITLADGKVINDEANTRSESTEITFDDRNLYLGNLNNHSESSNVNLYSNSETNDINVTIVKINNNYYLKTNDDNVRINIIDQKSGIKLIDAKKEDMQNETSFETDFSLDELDKVKTKRIRKRTLSYKEAFVAAFKKLFNMGKKAKILVVSLVLLGSMFSVSIHGLISNLVLDTSTIYTDENIYTQKGNYIGNTIEVPEDEDNYIVYSVSNYYNFILEIQGRVQNLRLENPIPLEIISKKNINITNGKLPDGNNKFEVVIDETVLDKKYANSIRFNSFGIFDAKYLIGETIKMENVELKIVGTVKTGTKAIYIDKSVIESDTRDMLLPMSTNNPNVNLVEGNLPSSKVDNIFFNGYSSIDVYEVVVSTNIDIPIAKDELGENENPGYSTGYILNNYGNAMFKVVGKAEYTNIPENTRFIDEEALKTYKSKNSFYTQFDSSMVIYKLNGLPNNIDLINNRTEQITSLEIQKSESMRSNSITMIIAVIVSGLVFFLLTRSSLTSRVKEISILRSLGVSKYEVVSLFSVEYFVLTAFSSLIGVAIGSYFVNAIYKSFLGDFIGLRVTPLSLIVSVIGIFLTNILLALIPVGLLLRKTPANMLTNYDI